MSIYTASGIEVDDEPDTEDLTLATDQWDLLADIYVDGKFCAGCRFNKTSWNVRRLRRERECDCQMPELCPGMLRR